MNHKCCPHCCEYVPYERVPEFVEAYKKARGLRRNVGVAKFGQICGLSKATLIHARWRGYLSGETARKICLHLNAASGKQGTPEAMTPRDFFPEVE